MLTLTLRFTPPLSDKAASFHQLAETGLYEGIGRLTQEASAVILEELKREAPVYAGPDPRRTGGKLRDTLHTKQRVGSGGNISVSFDTVAYARYGIEGTRSHEIEPVRAEALAFYLEDGLLHLAKHVHHPGTQPNPWPDRAWNAARDRVLEIMRRTGREILEKVK